jgi:DNA-binding NtrC family response regulator
MTSQERVLIVDDSPTVVSMICKSVAKQGYQPVAVLDGLAAEQKLQDETYRLVVSDVRLPGVDGLTLLSRYGTNGGTRFLMVSGQSTIDDAVEAMKLGAIDFLPKPFSPIELEERVKLALSFPLADKPAGPTELVGDSPAFRRILDQLDLLAAVPTAVLLTGETGTGKEVATRYLHERGTRAKGPFVSLHCGAVPDHLLEDELFGHVKGAFTGAIASRAGCFELADGGTLLLDEIGTMSLSLQSKLLRILQEPVVRRLGDVKSRKVDVRLVAATNANLEEMVARGAFRADLYYRLSVFPIQLPALRERPDDVAPLARHFIASVCGKLGLPLKTLSTEAETRLLARDWPGNVRELQNTIERAVVVSRGRPSIDACHLSFGNAAPDDTGLHNVESLVQSLSFDDVVKEFEKRLILKSLEISGGNKKHAAELLQLKRTTLIEKMRRFERNKRVS